MSERKGGKYLQTSSNNVEELLKHLGLGDDIIARVTSGTNTLEFAKEGEEVTIKSTTGDHVRETKFKIGEKYTETINGRQVPAVAVKEADNRVIHTIGEGEKQLKVVYEWNGNELRVTSTSGPVVAVRIAIIGRPQYMLLVTVLLPPCVSTRSTSGAADDVIARITSTTEELVFTKSGNGYTIQISRADHTREIKFEFGIEFTETYPNGRTVQSVFIADGNRLVRAVKGDKPMTTVYELIDNELRVTSTSGPVVAVRTYAKHSRKWVNRKIMMRKCYAVMENFGILSGADPVDKVSVNGIWGDEPYGTVVVGPESRDDRVLPSGEVYV
ncbi:unnamed protein product [Medioppia subpectinata]|uniref:Uncharacterized protein n=1 Tax=Medioppia subpectinata TaxID=1979941 RepID=A0A7R9KDR5_9ACAR|nr:unnamed protein product [Medioppia subpectinata]CAG2101257.1 unnamed protein product [Medioppia subpectinata]